MCRTERVMAQRWEHVQSQTPQHFCLQGIRLANGVHLLLLMLLCRGRSLVMKEIRKKFTTPPQPSPAQPHPEVGGAGVNPGKAAGPNGDSGCYIRIFKDLCRPAGWQLLELSVPCPLCHHDLSPLFSPLCLKRNWPLEIGITTIHVAMSSFGKLVLCHIIQSLPTALDPHQFAYGANRWTLPLRLSWLLGATNSSRRGWVLLILVRLSKQPSPTDCSPNWQSWASLHPSAAGSWTSCQNPSQRVRSSAPLPPHSASIQTFSSRKKVQQRPSFIRLRDSGRSPSNRNCSRLVSTATECGLVCGFFYASGGSSPPPRESLDALFPPPPPMNFIAPTASEKPKTSWGTPS